MPLTCILSFNRLRGLITSSGVAKLQLLMKKNVRSVDCARTYVASERLTILRLTLSLVKAAASASISALLKL
jgi:hypothetical protein